MLRRYAIGLVFAAACGGSDASPDSGTDAPAAIDAPTAIDTGSGGDAGADGAFGPDDCDAVWIERIEGSIADELGAPIADARPQACLRLAPDGVLVCPVPPRTAADGTYSLPLEPGTQCVESAAMRALLSTGPYAITYCHIDVSATADAVLTIAEPTILYRTEPPSVLPPLGDETVARAVVFEDGLEVDVVPAELGFGVDYDTLGARRIPLDAGAPCVTGGLADLAGLYAFADEGPVDAGDFPIRIPNTTGLAAGTSVELFVLGGLDTFLADGTPVDEADFVQFGTGTVSADGTHVASDPGSGLPHFSWLGYRPAP